MPDGKVIPATAEEYPELQDLPEGSKVKFDGEGTFTKEGIVIDSINLDTEDDATNELKKMTGNEGSNSGTPTKSNGF